MNRIYAVSDLHGRYDLCQEIKNYIDETWNQLLIADFSLELPYNDYHQHTESAIIALCETAYKLDFSHHEIEYILDHYYFSKNHQIDNNIIY